LTIIVKTGKNKVVGLFKLFQVFVDFMDPSFSNNKAKYLTLIQAAQMLSVSIDVLLQWNDFNILKPTITQRGQIVYSHEQIDKFLEAQQLLQNNKIDVENVAVNRAQEIITQGNQNIFITNISNAAKNKLFPVALAVTMSVIVVTILSVTNLHTTTPKTVAQNTTAPSQKQDTVSKTSPSQTDNTVLTESTPLSVQMKDGSSPYTPVDLTNKENKSMNLSYNRLTQGQVLGSKIEKSAPIESPKIDTLGYSEIAKFSEGNDNPNNLFDDAGNIKGDAPNPDVLGIATGISKFMHVDNAALPSANSQYIFMLMIVIAATTVILLRKLPAYSYHAHHGAGQFQKPDDIGTKVFEIDQKTDGTVVLYFKGEEYKLSKPELDSESDQFIERLMEVSDSDQEIDYDKSTDENIKLSTPLSKLVTRLGFVGTKRDLFFPRTSKNKVLFRRYITEEDLTAMNMNATELFKAFTANKSA
jgi:hypothetical protein